jgi:hypothetical protein
MVIEAGTVTLGFVLLRAACVPPAGAGPLSVTEHWLAPPAVTVAGLQLTDTSEGWLLGGAVTVKENVAGTPFSAAVRTAVTLGLPALDAAVKTAIMDPDWTSTEAGTLTQALLLLRATNAPPAGAKAVSPTVQVLLPDGLIVPGEQFKLDSTAAGG